MSAEHQATPAEVAAQLARVRDGLTEQAAEPGTASAYDRGQIQGAITGMNLALRLLTRVPSVDPNVTGVNEHHDATDGPDAAILPFPRS